MVTTVGTKAAAGGTTLTQIITDATTKEGACQDKKPEFISVCKEFTK